MSGIVLNKLATMEEFDEGAYLNANPDVAAAIVRGHISSAQDHLAAHGLKEGRFMRDVHKIESARREKIERVKSTLRLEMPHTILASKYNFLTEELRLETGIMSTDAVSAHGYDAFADGLVRNNPDWIILDCGAGRRPIYFSNVVNFEIVDYDTTDILGVGEHLPFIDNAFDAVLSLSVLEHVRDPFRCASEITRVLKPGGRLICCVPFLQPEHGYPHHYYNMAPQGLRALFDRSLTIDDHLVVPSIAPLQALKWIAQSWSNGLQGSSLDEFLALSIQQLIELAPESKTTWTEALSTKKQFELACATMLFAHKQLSE